ncbi:LytR C-terminal domain-containing protein [Sphingomonas glaciei]|uniref:LytR C-terminal domain-containing protein n=1 Tax=Sphingomonas glaciei TaxID=2938948 RepID=A0ABY5MV10_9SPHN|nr:LytR C-terminal domain-containing protein [Sphingomonas glaciei]UUR08323.1 LytR C-terminal domain-containing protein [Sphingomonas glaciei]
MRKILAIAVAALAASGCTNGGTLTIRPTGNALAQGAQSLQFRVNEAQAHLALGNVALASEGFRRALRDDPASVAALVGLAGCYDRMGRFDLSRLHYERALALQPTDGGILAAFAASLDRSGAKEEAGRVRTEVALRARPEGRVAPDLTALVAALDLDRSSALTEGGVLSWLSPAPQHPLVKLAQEHKAGPRLERSDLGEVILLTGKAPHWQPLPTPKLARAREVRPPLGIGSAPVRITILNAGTGEGRAAETRLRLRQLGWTGIAIANAVRALDRTELVYPAALEQEGKRLARQLKVSSQARRSDTVDRIILRLGRDSAGSAGRT